MHFVILSTTQLDLSIPDMPFPVSLSQSSGEAVSSSSALESPGQGLPLDAELETAPSRGPYPGNLSKAYPFWAFVSPLWCFHGKWDGR